jgi:hypothetical protein
MCCAVLFFQSYRKNTAQDQDACMHAHQKSVPIPEPIWEKTLGLMISLGNAGIQVLPKLIPKVAYKDFFVQVSH